MIRHAFVHMVNLPIPLAVMEHPIRILDIVVLGFGTRRSGRWGTHLVLDVRVRLRIGSHILLGGG
jgi:hypothetical protein